MAIKKVVLLCAVIAVTVFLCTFMFTKEYVKNDAGEGEVRLSDEDYETLKQYLEISDLQKIIQESYYQDVEIMLDYATGRTVKLGEITPEWWIK